MQLGKQAFLLINYFASFYIIFRRTSQNLIVLQEQLSFIDEEDIHSLHGTLNTKYTMFKYAVLPTASSLIQSTYINCSYMLIFIFYFSSGGFRAQCRWQQWHSSWYDLAHTIVFGFDQFSLAVLLIV